MVTYPELLADIFNETSEWSGDVCKNLLVFTDQSKDVQSKTEDRGSGSRGKEGAHHKLALWLISYFSPMKHPANEKNETSCWNFQII